jgi:hypothetical protein
MFCICVGGGGGSCGLSLVDGLIVSCEKFACDE